jgi:hypothetical protein|tara:strand:- start:29 stop:199 length:171 start_codon:yes stop_codon:yes gene_type:complete
MSFTPYDSFTGFINEGTFQEYDYNNQYNEQKEETTKFNIINNYMIDKTQNNHRFVP